MRWQKHAAWLSLFLLQGCRDNELGIEKRRANLPPQTILSSGPPDSTAATSYRVPLSWWGSDPDGNIDHFDFILVDHPAIQDSITGDDVNRVNVTVPEANDPRWTSTRASDSLFVTSADTLRCDPQPEWPDNPGTVRLELFQRWHTFFVRAVDDNGLADPTPDYLSFNATNIAPVVGLTAPVKPGLNLTGPPVIVFNWDGEDPIGDGRMQKPVASRWVMIPSQLGRFGRRFSSWPDSLYVLPERFSWSPWKRWNAADGSGVQAIMRNLPRIGDVINPPSGYYIFAVQALDEAGAITQVFDNSTVGKNNAVLVTVTGRSGPLLIINERFLGSRTFVGPASPIQLEAAVGQPIHFTWTADASKYGGTIDSFRWGWNVLNPDDDEQWDQGWSQSALEAPQRFVQRGTDRFRLEVRDNADLITSVVFDIVGHDLSRERDLLWVDDTEPIASNPNDENVEDERWISILTELAREHGFDFDPAVDVYDVFDNRLNPPSAQLVFKYKSVVWSVQNGANSRSALRELSRFSDPFSDRDLDAARPFNYLNGYLNNGGQLWINGFRPALQLWPSERASGAQSEPINVTNWDDPIDPHPFVDSVGTKSLLYLMGVEMFDLGSGVGSNRPQLEHFCKGLQQASPVGFESQDFESSQANEHTHHLELLNVQVDFPPAAGFTISTAVANDHTHEVHLTQENFQELQQGRRLEVSTTPNTTPDPHAHTFELLDHVGLWGVPLLVTGSGWSTVAGSGRANVEIYNMPAALAGARPPLLPLQGVSIPLYVYKSGLPAEPQSGVLYPLTADLQPTFVLSKNSPFDLHYSRAICGFPPALLARFFHKQLVRFVVVRHFQLGDRALGFETSATLHRGKG